MANDRAEGCRNVAERAGEKSAGRQSWDSRTQLHGKSGNGRRRRAKTCRYFARDAADERTKQNRDRKGFVVFEASRGSGPSRRKPVNVKSGACGRTIKRGSYDFRAMAGSERGIRGRTWSPTLGRRAQQLCAAGLPETFSTMLTTRFRNRDTRAHRFEQRQCRRR